MNLPGPYCLRPFLALLAVALFAPMPSLAQGPKAPQWSYAFDLSCRKYGEEKFTKDTKKWGFEVFRDANTGYGVFINQAGNLGVTTTFNVTPPLKDSKAPAWVYGLDLRARKAGEDKFSDKTKAWGLEVFFDNNSGNWVYIVENGNFAVAPGKVTGIEKPLEKPKDCRWLHSFDLKCRKGGQTKWDKDTPIYGLEIYQDLNNNNLVYISDSGSVAVVPWGQEISKSEGKGPEWLHGQDLQSRKYKEENFTDKTKKYGVEIFRDANNGNLILLDETGHLTVTPGPKDVKSPTKDPKNAKFLHGLDLSVRSAGQDTFDEKTPTYSVEIYDEPNVSAVIYLAQSGAIAAVGKK